MNKRESHIQHEAIICLSLLGILFFYIIDLMRNGMGNGGYLNLAEL